VFFCLSCPFGKRCVHAVQVRVTLSLGLFVQGIVPVGRDGGGKSFCIGGRPELVYGMILIRLLNGMVTWSVSLAIISPGLTFYCSQ
jgi:hypothetical protein